MKKSTIVAIGTGVAGIIAGVSALVISKKKSPVVEVPVTEVAEAVTKEVVETAIENATEN